MNPHEARLRVFETITDFFISMGEGDEPMTPAEKVEVEESLSELTELMLDMLQFQVESAEETEGGLVVVATIKVG